MAAHSSTLAWKIPWTEEPGGLQSMGLQRVGHDWRLHFHNHFHFTEDSGSEKLSDLPKLTQLNSNIIMILLHVSLLSSPYGLTLNHG